MEVDLHGIKHEDVKQILDAHIWKCMSKKMSRLWVITGHSEDMRQIVTNVAREYGLTAVTSLFNEAEMIIDFI